MAYEAENVGAHMHNAIGGVAGAAMAAWMMSRQDAGRREAENAAACATAASRARAAVFARSADDLRERLADAHADIEVLEYTNGLLRKQIAELEQRCRILAEAVTEAGLAD